MPKYCYRTRSALEGCLQNYFYFFLNVKCQINTPLEYDNGTYAVSCISLLAHKKTGETRVFRQSFAPRNPSADYDVVREFDTIPFIAVMTSDFWEDIHDEVALVERLAAHVPDSDWEIIGVQL